MEAKTWSTTESNMNLWHSFDEDGKAICNKRIWARHYSRIHNDYRTLSRVRDSPFGTPCERCLNKIKAAAPVVETAEVLAARLLTQLPGSVMFNRTALLLAAKVTQK